ncbi:3-hydroxyacyl-CoA dehydrogenase NAD-binding domain-containing protein [Desulfosporosinus sp. PR]|uniref:3-hydroxyacyl-CoA dehydrogenase NAD-binding domain-containing protein n=1 Tax=Candidatus Desulfosporosinus nitrosoreducens TaxID=3401928 RepID=UPI0027FF2FD8|nr:3-hydroxyacyl-CoA dehydrogenase NAD-binding domain-containing protein [Desulfosporosinus sp. PR]MDQ7093565.1 3-hydroxyacyl-CoA dehydrogenase NAD-binding domain-containing protein [Desulfosporosinus sp. PR]
MTEPGAFTRRPDKIAGMHVFNPVPVMELIEIVKGLSTSQKTIEALKEVAQMNKRGVVVNDTPGFIVNRLLVLLCNEAIKMMEREVASSEGPI